MSGFTLQLRESPVDWNTESFARYRITMSDPSVVASGMKVCLQSCDPSVMGAPWTDCETAENDEVYPPEEYDVPFLPDGSVLMREAADEHLDGTLMRARIFDPKNPSAVTFVSNVVTLRVGLHVFTGLPYGHNPHRIPRNHKFKLGADINAKVGGPNDRFKPSVRIRIYRKRGGKWVVYKSYPAYYKEWSILNTASYATKKVVKLPKGTYRQRVFYTCEGMTAGSSGWGHKLTVR